MRHMRKLAVLCCVAAAVGWGARLAHADPLVSMQLTGVEGPVMDGADTSPYMAQIGPAGLTSASEFTSSDPIIDVICDDFAADASVGQVWQATVTNMSALQGLTSPLTTLLFGTTGTAYEQEETYMAAAWLAEDLVGVNQSTAAGQQEAGELSFAIWGIFDSSALSYLSETDSADLPGVLSDISEAYSEIQLSGYNEPSDYSNVYIYTPDPGDATQEFLAVRPVPEPGTLALFGLGLVAIVWVTRRRLRHSRAVA